MVAPPKPAKAQGQCEDAVAWVDDGTRKPIPQPPETFMLGNLPDIDSVKSLPSIRHLAQLYGPIYQLRLGGKLMIFVSSQKLAHYLCNEDRFEKVLSSPLVQVRNFAGDGLFTAYAGEHNWTLAHRILIPAFGPIAIKKMQPMMTEIIAQMLVRWETHAGQPFEASDQFTRLTLVSTRTMKTARDRARSSRTRLLEAVYSHLPQDTIGWCAFRYRFNSFFTDRHAEFIDIMVKLLVESGVRSRRPGILNSLMFGSDREYQANIAELHKQCDEIVAARRANPDPEAHDLLNNMILDKDPKTGEHLSDDNIRYQMVTFLIAGHETTSGMLSFATYYLLKNPR
jgi:cytochrome P450/NADPH-cytochrome P450 reductase